MAKKKIKLSNKIINSKTFSVEGILDCDSLQEGVIYVEIEDEGSVDICEYIKQFADNDVKITITTKTSEEL
jgi:hypothetical protein